jgi:ATP-dependent RNA helicase DDX51/DBP6
MLVVDETDRLLRQDYQNWLPAVLSQLPRLPSAPGASPSTPATAAAASSPSSSSSPETTAVPLLPYGQPRPVKLIVSATLTRDPSKLSRLDLHCPRFISLTSLGGRRYTLPAGLELTRVVAQAHQKPLALVALLHRLKGVPTLVFASSVEATHRWGAVTCLVQTVLATAPLI